MNSGNKSFFQAHWDWLVAAAGAAALAGGAFMFLSGGKGADDIDTSMPSAAKTGVTAVETGDGTEYGKVTLLIDKPGKVTVPAEERESFLASGRRIFCESGEAEKQACGLPIPEGVETCPHCGVKQPAEPTVTLDSDGDGLPDDWEKENGYNPNDPADAQLDKDGDTFTTLEEYQAGTSPEEATSHPSYLEFLTLELPLKETLVPFYFERAMKLPAGYRFYFKDPNKKNAYGQKGETYTPLAGEEIGKTGYVVKNYEQKTKTRQLAAAKGEKALSRTDDASEVTVERKSDGKTIVLVVGEKKRKPVDVQAKLVWNRNGVVKEYTVVPGDTIEIINEKYKVTSIKTEGKKVSVSVSDPQLGGKTLEALEQ